jgi:hypothetical protein
VTSNAPLGPPPSESRATRTPIGSPSRTTSRGRGRAGAGVAPARLVVFAAACFAFTFRGAVACDFGVWLGAARTFRDGVTVVVTGRDVEVALGACEVSAAGAACPTPATGRFGAGAAVEDATTGASGVGTARADSDARFAGRDAGAAGAFDGVEVEDVANPPGGSSGAGIGVPPAAQPAAGQPNATTQTHAATESRLSRRDDVHLDTTSLPFGDSRYVG